MIIDCVTVGDMGENCYLAGDPSCLLMIDPGDEAEKILSYITQKNYTIGYIVLTHCHFDHTGAVAEVLKKTGAKLVLGAGEAENYKDKNVTLGGFFSSAPVYCVPDILLHENEEVVSGRYRFKVLETPGHTSGSICLVCEDVLFSGDTLFCGSIGRTDFPTGSLPALIASVRDKLFTLPDETRVYPGHGGASTIGFEKEHNEVYEWERRNCESLGGLA